MSIDCFCDYNPPEFCETRIQTARKKHRCYECSGFVAPGEKYEYTAGKWEGYFNTFRVCERCYDIRKWVQNNVPCFCWAFGNMDDDAANAVEDARDRAREETVGLKFGLLRRIALRDKFNKSRAELVAA